MKTNLASLMTTFSVACFLGATSMASTACTWETDLPDDVKDIPVDKTRELVITDDDLLLSLSKNQDAKAPLGFRHAVERLPLEKDAMHRWMRAWSQRLIDENAPARASAFDAKVTCAWLRATPSNRCASSGGDDACASCAAHDLDLAKAPFRLVAIVNRTDLSVLPDRAAEGGEGRLVYALTDGPADDPSSKALPFTVIFEYAQRGTAREWTERWHALGDASKGADEFSKRLVGDVTSRFVETGALAQLRTGDALSGTTLVMHQFEIDNGNLVARNVRNSPDWARVPQTMMQSYAHDHAASIDEGTAVLPKEWWAASSSPTETPPGYVASLDHHDALVRGTCGGCHQQSETGFHIDPQAKGDARLSRFLVDPTKPSDELRRRVLWMQLMLTRD